METVVVNGRKGLTDDVRGLPRFLLSVRIQDVMLASDWWHKLVKFINKLSLIGGNQISLPISQNSLQVRPCGIPYLKVKNLNCTSEEAF